MPGIITHSRLFQESLFSLKKAKDATPFGKSIEALYSVPERLKAGLFGSIGPDIFDYLPVARRNFFGTSLSMQIHSSRLSQSLTALLSRTLLVGDFNNEWSATRRAYSYGFIAHLIADAVFHPFVYYWAGFPDNGSRFEIYRYREQLLLFQYNMDLFFQYHYNTRVFDFAIDDSLPMRHIRGGIPMLDYRIKSLILEMLTDTCPGDLPRLIWNARNPRDTDGTWKSGPVDLIPYFIRRAYLAKRSRSRALRMLSRNCGRVAAVTDCPAMSTAKITVMMLMLVIIPRVRMLEFSPDATPR